MAWSSAPEQTSGTPLPGWGPTPQAGTPVYSPGWGVLFRRILADLGVGEDGAQLGVAQAVADAGVGADLLAAPWFHGLPAAIDLGVGQDAGYASPGAPIVDAGIGYDQALPRVRADALDRGLGTDLAINGGLAIRTTDVGLGHDLATTRPCTPAADTGHGHDLAASFAFTPQAASLVTVTTTGGFYVDIPAWCRYIDMVLLGAGAGGAAGNLFLTGNGGKPGSYATKRWDRGASRNAWRRIWVVLGNGGGSGNGAGGATEIWIDDWGDPPWTGEYLGAPGGSGTNSGRDADGPGNQAFNGINATGGSGNGNAPGSGGRGGASGFSPGSGDPGAPGRAWIRFSM